MVIFFKRNIAVRGTIPFAFCVLILLFGAFSAETVRAAEIRQFSQFKVLVAGEIMQGDSAKLEQMLDSVKFARAVILDSPGGSVAAAIALAEEVKRRKLETEVIPGGICASSCFLIFISGSPRRASGSELMGDRTAQIEKLRLSQGGRPDFPFRPAGFVGIHRPYFRAESGSTNAQSHLMRALTSYLEENMLSRRLIDLMMSRPSNDIYWLSEADLIEMGPYGPDAEELLIRKCDYDRNALRKNIELLERGRRLEADAAQVKADRATQCEIETMSTERQTAKASLQKRR